MAVIAAFSVCTPAGSGSSLSEGAKLTTPQLGNTQDLALHYWLTGRGPSADTEGSGDVSILPQGNVTALQAFLSKDIDSGWLPEP